MNTIDLTPLYRSSIGFDRFGSLLDMALRSDQSAAGFPPYNIEATGENSYTIALAVAGFTIEDLEIQVENNMLTVRGKKADDDKPHNYLYQGIATRNFERRFNLADYVKVRGAQLNDGLLTINLVKEIPEAMKPKRIEINSSGEVLELASQKEKVA